MSARWTEFFEVPSARPVCVRLWPSARDLFANSRLAVVITLGRSSFIRRTRAASKFASVRSVQDRAFKFRQRKKECREELASGPSGEIEPSVTLRSATRARAEPRRPHMPNARHDRAGRAARRRVCHSRSCPERRLNCSRSSAYVLPLTPGRPLWVFQCIDRMPRPCRRVRDAVTNGEANNDQRTRDELLVQDRRARGNLLPSTHSPVL